MKAWVTFAVAAAAVTFGIAACSSDATRENFEETPETGSPVEVTPPPPKSDAATTEKDSGPSDATAPDAGPDSCKRTAPSKACGLVPQCGCLETETCHVEDDDGNVACIAAGKAKMGAPCTGTQGCLKGLSCVFGTCHAFCDKPGSACADPGTGSCIQVQGPSGAIPNWQVCLVKCDLRDALSCGGTTKAGIGACIVDDKGNTDCQEGGTRKENELCGNTTNEDCGPALVCVTVTSGGSTTNQCKKWCRVGQSADCGGKSCQGFGTKVLVGGVEYGVCAS